MTPETVRDALRTADSPTALLDLLEYGYAVRPGELKEWRIAAFIVRPDWDVLRIELGQAAAVHAEVAAWRESLRDHRDPSRPGAELRRRLWEPLAVHLDGIDTVLISPDGVLAQIPWGALPGSQPGTFLIEERRLAVIPVPQMIAEVLGRKAALGRPPSLLLAGDIDYGGKAGAPQVLSSQRNAVGRLRDGTPREYGRLRAGKVELASIARWYRQKARSDQLTTISGANATEEVFRSEAGRHQWVHLATHGYFAPASIQSIARSQPDAELSAARSDAPESADSLAGIGVQVMTKDGRCLIDSLIAAGAAERDGRLHAGDELLAVAGETGPWVALSGRELNAVLPLLRGRPGTTVKLKVSRNEKRQQEMALELERRPLPALRVIKPLSIHPGLLSGLAFAGANRPPEPTHDDGILTALEVEALDLTQVDTVVLSACETGLGEVAGGEGLLGLQRAFQVAGAKTVVASLWKVDDDATQALMSEFYANLWEKNLPKLEALRQAQLIIMRTYDPIAGTLRGKVDLLNKSARAGSPPPAQAKSDRLPPYYWAAFVLSGDWR
jgi:CHAT domain-containing protein